LKTNPARSPADASAAAGGAVAVGVGAAAVGTEGKVDVQMGAAHNLQRGQVAVGG
jgi:hypothetical protein